MCVMIDMYDIYVIHLILLYVHLCIHTYVQHLLGDICVSPTNTVATLESFFGLSSTTTSLVNYYLYCQGTSTVGDTYKTSLSYVLGKKCNYDTTCFCICVVCRL